MSMCNLTVVYEPRILRNLIEICRVMGVGKDTVRVWVSQGAHIIVEGCGRKQRYSAELMRLQLWRETAALSQECRGGRDVERTVWLCPLDSSLVLRAANSASCASYEAL